MNAVPKTDIVELHAISVIAAASDRRHKAASGFYCGHREGQALPTIFLCADNIFKNAPRWTLHIGPV